MTASLDLEIVCRVHDPNDPNNGTISVRVCFTQTDFMLDVYGVFRLDDDSEIDQASLSVTDQDTLLTACEHEVANRQREQQQHNENQTTQ